MTTQEALLVDLGSTMTKVRVVDLPTGRLVAAAAAPTTAETGVAEGLQEALRAVGRDDGAADYRAACSSAAGGLRMVAVGLVPSLTTEAARRAALGAGAKVIGTYGYALRPSDLATIRASDPDIVLLAGGIDGGNQDVVLGNARLLARADLDAIVVMAGNATAADDVAAAFEASTVECVVTENVMPEVGSLNLDPCREVIRRVFEHRIVHARGMAEAEKLVGTISMPTPLAVMRGAELLSAGTEKQEGLGDLVVLDIGGATTDVHSICDGLPHDPTVVMQGLPEPRSKRSVEGDLGIRVNAANVMDFIRRDPTLTNPNADRWTQTVDIRLAGAAAMLAMRRHAGSVERVRSARGWLEVQRGKDLSEVRTVIGTGGVFRDVAAAHRILERILAPHENLLTPRRARMMSDQSYCLAAAGLLRSHDPEAAFSLAKESLVEV